MFAGLFHFPYPKLDLGREVMRKPLISVSCAGHFHSEFGGKGSLPQAKAPICDHTENRALTLLDVGAFVFQLSLK